MKRFKSKNGFTLIELLVSMAILAVLFPAITSAFLNTQEVMQAEDSKFDTMALSQSIVQKLQVEGRDKVGDIYGDFKKLNADGKEYASVYVYYDVGEDTDINEDPIPEVSDAIKKMESGNKRDNVYIIPDGSVGSIENAKTADEALAKEKEKVANIFIAQEDDYTAKYYKVYRVSVETWDLKRENNVGSKRIVYIGE